MGVRGLTTYIKKNQRKYLKTHRLHNCNLIIDGNSIATQLYTRSCQESAFGGDYDKYFDFVRVFFKLLSKCMVTPYVIFDGGYEKRKIKTVHKRMREKIECTRDVLPFTHSYSFPLFMRVVFREALIEMGIRFAQNDFEADDEIAAIARQLNCPVLSYDSDFFIYDVLYIPFPTMTLETCQMETLTSEDAKYYIECKIYSVEYFVSRFGGLNRDMLPLMAAVLGNDYIQRSVFKKFYQNLNIAKGKKNHLEKRVSALLNWLQNETFQSALLRIVGRMKKTRQRFVAGQIKRIASGYTQCSSVLNPYLSIEVERISSIEPEVCKILDVIETEGDYPGLYTVGDDNEASSTSDDENEEEEDEEISVSEDMRIVTPAVINIGDDETQTDDANEIDWKELLGEELKLSGEELTNENDIPDWLLDSFRGGKVHSCVMDILTLRTYFCVPQIEEYAYPHSHQISLAILRVIAGLLLESNDILLRYWTRNNNNKLDWFTAEPITATNSCNKFPSLKRLPETPLSIRKQIFMEALSLEKELISVPCEWELFVATTVFWLKNMKDPRVSVYHLHTLVMCIVCINLIDSRLGRYRIKRYFTKKYGKLLSAKEQQMKASKSVPNPASTVKLDINKEKSTISDCLKNVLKEDCIVIFNSILPYHHISEQLKIKPKHFDRTIVHAFSQFQSCFHLALVLNSVLNFPIEHCFVSKFFSGTFIYNMYTNLSKRSNLDAYIETFFSRVPRILQLYKQIINFILSLVPDDMFTETITKMRKKKKKPKSPLVITSQVDKRDNSEEELFIDENNKFSLLSVNATS